MLFNLFFILFITVFIVFIIFTSYFSRNSCSSNSGCHSLESATIEQFREDDWGFVICRHVNQKKVNDYWKECIRCIRRFHPTSRIIIIDDYSNPEMIDKEEERRILMNDTHITIIQSEFKGAGELLPYYYFHKYRWFEYAIIIHDSVFLNSPMTSKLTHMYTTDSNIAFLWSFKVRGFDDNNMIDHYLQLLEGRDELFKIRKMDKWKGCFGVMTCIRLSFIDKLVEDHRLFDILLPRIKTRNDRMTMERVMSIIIHAHMEREDVDTFFGDIHDFCRWGYNYEDYKNKVLDHLPIIKVWTGR
uniref:Glycosyltransferase 2-like domain-containing protein n=1 Tax=viral metagenome TaxID=1070528 RepID=A0A6C0D266_9ZZZZ